VLQLLPFIFIIYADASAVENWTDFSLNPEAPGLDILLCGGASAVEFFLIAQIV